MTEQWERELDPSPEWQNLCDMIDAAVDKPTGPKFAAVGRAAVLWMQARRASPRDVTSLSTSETPLYKEVLAETVALDHNGQEIVPNEAGEYVSTGTHEDSVPAGPAETQ